MTLRDDDLTFLDYERGGSTVNTLLLGAGIGAACMYLIDPSRGALRRGVLRDKAIHAAHRTADGIGAVARDVSHRAQGTWASAKSRVRQTEASDDVVVARVRAKLGRYVSHPHAIEVRAYGGRVTLLGKILKHEVNGLMQAIGQVPGVSEIDNLLEEHETAGNIPSLQGGTHRRGDQHELLQTNWTPATRTLVGSIGSAMVTYGASRRDLVGALVGAAGAGFVLRAATNVEAKRLLGVAAGRRAVDLQKTIHINAPVSTVFSFWSNYENFPLFMRNVLDVRPTALEGQSHWTVAGPWSAPIEFNAMLTEFVPDRVLAWKTVDGSAIAHAGIVQFELDGELGTRIHIRFSYNPPGGAIAHALALLLGDDLKSKMDEDLARMKSLIETGRAPHDAAKPVADDPGMFM